MTDGERLKQFHADFEKLKHNREQVPLDILTSKYAAGYNAQVKKVQEGADWFFSKYQETLAFPPTPRTPPGTSGWPIASPFWRRTKRNPEASGTRPKRHS